MIRIKHLLLSLWNSDKYRKFIEFERLFLKYGHLPRHLPLTLTFRNYRFEIPDALSVLWQIKDYFLDENYRFNSKTDSPVIYDCGANVGVASLYFKRIFPKSRIKAFEADVEIAKYLERNLRGNFCFDNVQIIPKAVWVTDDGVGFGSEGADTGSIFSGNRKKKIESVRLRSLLEQEISVDLLKMDIEGAEAPVLKDCENVLHKVKYMFVEYHVLNNKQEMGEILSLLSRNHFRYCLSQAELNSPFITFDRSRAIPSVNIFAINERID